jgi:AcrR family transcriptional regulator
LKAPATLVSLVVMGGGSRRVGRAGLTRIAVVEAAATLADEEGLESVSLARLAERLGVRSPSLFKHVRGLQDLQRELAVLGFRTLSDTLRRAVGRKQGEAALPALARAYRKYARHRPGLYAAAFRMPDTSDPVWIGHGLALTRVLLGPLGDFGLTGDDAVHMARALRCTLHGFVGLEAIGAYWFPVDVDESFRRQIDAFMVSVRAVATGRESARATTQRRKPGKPGRAERPR